MTVSYKDIDNNLGVDTFAKIKYNFEQLNAAVAALQSALGSNVITSQGTFVANGATPVVVADANITALSQIIITLKTVGGTVSPSIPYVNTKTAGTGFHVTATALDTSTYSYTVLN